MGLYVYWKAGSAGGSAPHCGNDSLGRPTAAVTAGKDKLRSRVNNV